MMRPVPGGVATGSVCLVGPVATEAVTSGVRALHAAREAELPISDTLWRDRYGNVVDPWRHPRGIASHVELLDDHEVTRRAAWLASRGGG